jgi:hypothetical protein
MPKRESFAGMTRRTAMGDVFPAIYSLKLADASPGSIVVFPRTEGHLLALVTTETAQKEGRSIVILNSKQPNYPPVFYGENWNEMCLCYDAPLRFELSNKEEDIGTSNRWWRASGIIVSTNREILIRASLVYQSRWLYVNLRNGETLSSEIPGYHATFGVWSLWLRDPLREKSMKIVEFDVHKTYPD